MSWKVLETVLSHLKYAMKGGPLIYNTIASRTNDVMTQTRLRQTNWNGG